MRETDVHTVVDTLRNAGVEAWIAGGWGVDALLGVRTRRHRDLDVIVEADPDNGERAVQALAAIGFRLAAETEGGVWMPQRYILDDDAGHIVDLLPVDFSREPFASAANHEHGSGMPDRPFATFGTIAGRPVECVSAYMQIALHEGYPAREIDKRDIDRLRAAPGLARPLNGRANSVGSRFSELISARLRPRAVRDAGYGHAYAMETPMAEQGITALPWTSVVHRDGPRRWLPDGFYSRATSRSGGDTLEVPRHSSRSAMTEAQEQAPAEPRAAPAATADRLDYVPMILMYHNIAEIAEDPMQLCVAPTRFAEQMSWLRTHGLRGVGIGTLIDEMRAGRQRGLVGITFDDGYVSVLEAAVPELLRHGFTATMFIVSGRLGGSNEWCEGPAQPLMSAEHVGELIAAGMEVGSHGATHVRLAGIAADQLEAEVSGSKARIAELTGTPVRGFAYPYGSMDAAARCAVRDAGYDYACAMATPMADLGIMALPRIDVLDRDGPRRLAAKRLLFTGGSRPLAAKRMVFRGYLAAKRILR